MSVNQDNVIIKDYVGYAEQDNDALYEMAAEAFAGAARTRDKEARKRFILIGKRLSDTAGRDDRRLEKVRRAVAGNLEREKVGNQLSSVQE